MSAGNNMRIRTHLIGAVVLGVLPIHLRAQSPSSPPLAIGERVRLEIADSARRITGTVVARQGDTVAINPRGAATNILVAAKSIDRYEVSAGRERGRGARRGALVGGALAIGLITVVAIDAANHPQQDVMIPWQIAVLPPAVVITGLGAGVGAIVAPERWETRWTRTARRESGVRVGMALSF
jgi:hypothetical protein